MLFNVRRFFGLAIVFLLVSVGTSYGSQAGSARKIWEKDLDAYWVEPVSADADGTVFCGDGKSVGGSQPRVVGTIYALSGETGKTVWKTPIAFFPSVISVFGDVLLVLGSPEYDAGLNRCMRLDRKTGKVLSTAICDSGGLRYVSRDGRSVYRLLPSDGRLLLKEFNSTTMTVVSTTDLGPEDSERRPGYVRKRWLEPDHQYSGNGQTLASSCGLATRFQFEVPRMPFQVIDRCRCDVLKNALANAPEIESAIIAKANPERGRLVENAYLHNIRWAMDLKGDCYIPVYDYVNEYPDGELSSTGKPKFTSGVIVAFECWRPGKGRLWRYLIPQSEYSSSISFCPLGSGRVVFVTRKHILCLASDAN